MAKKQRSGNIWYAVKGIVPAIMILIMVILNTTSGIAKVAAVLGGVYLLLWGLCCMMWGESPFALVFGFVVLAAGSGLIGLDVTSNTWFLRLSTTVTFLLIAFIGFKQRKKFRDPYCEGTVYEKPRKILAHVIFWGLMVGGLLIVVEALLGIPHPTKAIRILIKLFMAIGTIGVLAGSISWIAYVLIVEKALKLNGRTINSYKRGSSSPRPRASSDSRSSSEGANIDAVERAMISVAKAYSGDRDVPWRDCTIIYDLSVDVEKGRVNFLLKCSLSGTYDEQFERGVMLSVSEKIDKKKTKILLKAQERLAALNPSDDYLITVEAQTV